MVANRTVTAAIGETGSERPKIRNSKEKNQIEILCYWSELLKGWTGIGKD